MAPCSQHSYACNCGATARRLDILLVSTTVAPLGSGGGGGVELLVLNLAKVLPQLGHRVTVLAPAGSSVGGLDQEHGFQLLLAPAGPLERMAQHRTSGDEASVRLGSALANVWLEAALVQQRFHVIVNFCFDWLPMYQSYAFSTPILHWIQMGSQGDPVDDMVARLASERPGFLAAYTRAQAMTFPHGGEAFTVLGMGLDLSLYPFRSEPGDGIAWAGRIAPEKGVEDVMAAAEALGEELHIFGLDEQGELPRLMRLFPGLRVRHHGFLGTTALAEGLGRCHCLAMTPKWQEAFGIVAAEALACGLPVVSYARGGPLEIVEDGRTGFLVAPDDVDALVRGLASARDLDRAACRRAAEARFGLTGLATRAAAWMGAALEATPRSNDIAVPQRPDPKLLQSAAMPPEPLGKPELRLSSKDTSAASTTSSETAQEPEGTMEGALETVLRCVGEDPKRDGLLRTPHRFARAMEFLTSGYSTSLEEIVNDAIFEEDHHEMVIVKDIDMYSLCEHHVLPFFGKVHIAYVPNGKIIGLSKFARIVELFARRLQVQERITSQIADTLQSLLEPKGVGVITECSHMCMAMRGVEKQGSTTISSAMRGALKDDATLRQEFFMSTHSRR